MQRAKQRRQTILQVVENDPGIGFIELQKNTGLVNGVLSHHLNVLQREGSIRIKRDTRKIWIFHSDQNPDEDNLRIFLRKETCKKILVFLLENHTCTFSQIRDSIRKSPSTTSLTLKTLIEKGLVKKIHGFPHKYTLENYEKTANLASAIRVSQIDSLTEKFADTFSYY